MGYLGKGPGIRTVLLIRHKSVGLSYVRTLLMSNPLRIYCARYLVFLQWRLNHASSKERLCSLADVVRHHRYEHARTFVEAVCQEAVQLTDYLPVLQRFLCQPT